MRIKRFDWGLLPALVLVGALLAAMLAAPPAAYGQDGGQGAGEEGAESGRVDTALQSPRAALFSFLGAINEASTSPNGWARALACLDLSGVHPDRRKEVATELLGVINRLGEVKAQDLPDKAAVSATSLRRFQFFPRAGVHDWVGETVSFNGAVVLAVQDDGAWRFSATTLAGVSDLYRDLSGLEVRYGLDEKELSLSQWIENKMPAMLRGGHLFSMAYWQWLLLLLLVMIGTVVDQGVRLVVRKGAKRALDRIGAKAEPTTIHNAIKPLGMAAMAVFWTAFLHVLGLPEGALVIFLGAARVFAVLAVTVAAWRVTDVLGEVFEEKASLTDNKFNDMLLPLLRKTTKVFIVLFGSLYLATALDFEVGPLVAALGLGGFGFAFAAKDTIENFFGSIAVLLDRPFDVGDVVSIGGVDGSVEEIGFRSTRIRTFYNSQVTLPNATLVRAVVDNYGRRERRRFRTSIGVEYGTPVDKLVAFVEGIRELIRRQPHTGKDNFVVHFNDFGPSSLDILMQVFFETTEWSVELRERERLLFDIMKLGEQLGVSFAFPTQTLHLFKEEGSGEHRPGAIFGADDTAASMTLGADTARKVLTAQNDHREQEASEDDQGMIS